MVSPQSRISNLLHSAICARTLDPASALVDSHPTHCSSPSTFPPPSRTRPRVLLNQQPGAADIRRKNADFAARAQAGKRTTRPARSVQKRSVGTWVLFAMGFLVVGGSESYRPHHYHPWSAEKRVGVEDERADWAESGAV